MASDEIISCPACGVRFRLPPGRRPRPGMRMKCGACGHIWSWEEDADTARTIDEKPTSMSSPSAPPPNAEPPDREPSHLLDDDEDEDMPVPPRVLDEDDEGDETSSSGMTQEDDTAHLAVTEAEDVLRRLRERNRGIARRGDDGGEDERSGTLRRALLIVGWGTWAAFLVALVAVLVLFPEQAVRIYPPLARLYHAQEADTVEEAASVRDRAPLSVVIDGQPEWRPRPNGGYDLVVAGHIVNRASSEVGLPPLVVELVAEDGGEVLRHRRIEPSVRMLPAGGEIAFEAVIENAPTRPARIVARLVADRNVVSGPRHADDGDKGNEGHGTHSRR